MASTQVSTQTSCLPLCVAGCQAVPSSSQEATKYFCEWIFGAGHRFCDCRCQPKWKTGIFQVAPITVWRHPNI